jgi:uncharacterized protein YifN (PemK superfamily)
MTTRSMEQKHTVIKILMGKKNENTEGLVPGENHRPVTKIQYYVIKFVGNMRQVGIFFPDTPISSTNKTDHHDISEILLKVALNTINPNPNHK